MDTENKKDPGAWLPAALVALGLALTVMLVVMHNRAAWLGLAMIGAGAVMQYAARPRSSE